MTDAIRIRRAISASITAIVAILAHDARALSTQDVEWQNGEVTLSGTVYLPDGDGPFPAFVFLHGSGPETRSAFTMTRYAREFSRHGIAMLLYDKRGAGKSTGNWLESDYADLADDAVQGIELLAGRADIDAGRIGVIGASEGGWTGPLTAVRSTRVRWLILISAPPMSPLEQGIYELEASLRSQHVPDAQIAEAAALERRIRDVQRTDQGWDELRDAIEAAKSRPWYEAAGKPDMPDTSKQGFAWYRRVMDYDPLPALRSLRMPVLMMYGARDPLVDAARSAQIMREIAESEGKDFTIHVYPDSGHNLTLNEVKFPEDHWDRIFGWIDRAR